MTAINIIILFPADQSSLLQPLAQDSVLRQDVTQQEVVLLLLCGNHRIKCEVTYPCLCFVRARQ